MTQALLVSALRSSGQRLIPGIGARVVRASTVMALNRGARCRAQVESIGLTSRGVIVVWGRALCVNPSEGRWLARGRRVLASRCFGLRRSVARVVFAPLMS